MKLKQLVILSLVIVLTACGESGTPRKRVESNLSEIGQSLL